MPLDRTENLRRKLEEPQRVVELNPPDTLRRIGIKENDVFCDVGAGTGIFTFAAALITANTIYAVDISPGMRQIIHAETLRRKAANVVPLAGIDEVPAASCHLVLLSTVLHEVADKMEMIGEVKRLLAPHGQLAIIEFHKRLTPTGPPQEIRLDSVELSETMRCQGFHLVNQFTLGDNMYCLVFRQG